MMTVMSTNGSGEGLFQDNIEFTTGYNRKVVPVAEISRWVDLTQPYVINIEPLENAIGREVTFGLIDFVEFKKSIEEVRPQSNQTQTIVPAQSNLTKAKCVVWDLDNTVWRGDAG